MKPTVVKLTACVLLLVGMLTVSSCKSSKPAGETTSVAAIQQGVPGGIFVETHTVTADVTAVDAAKRTVTLKTAKGKKEVVKCGPEVVNFDQIQVGDKVRVTATNELAIAMAAGPMPPAEGAAAAVALAPKGAKPGVFVASTVQVAATVTKINLKRHRATLQFPDGTTRTVDVRPDVDLTQHKVGEKVVIRATESLAISVDKQ